MTIVMVAAIRCNEATILGICSSECFAPQLTDQGLGARTYQCCCIAWIQRGVEEADSRSCLMLWLWLHVVGWSIQQSTTKIKHTNKQIIGIVHNAGRVVWRATIPRCFNESGWNISGEYDCAMKRWQRYPMKRGVVLSVQMYDRGCDSMMFDHTHTRTPNHVMSHVGSNAAI